MRNHQRPVCWYMKLRQLGFSGTKLENLHASILNHVDHDYNRCGSKNLNTYLKNSCEFFFNHAIAKLRATEGQTEGNEILWARKYEFIHVHTKFQFSSFIRSWDIVDLFLGVLSLKMPFFKKTIIFVNKSKSVISQSNGLAMVWFQKFYTIF